jgi:hypothetical protein
MASLQGFMDGATDYKHMYNIKDRKGYFPVPEQYKTNSILGYLQGLEHPFFEVIKKTPICSMYSDPNAYITLFVPDELNSSDLYINIVRKHTLDFSLDMDYLQKNKGSMFYTLKKGCNLMVDDNLLIQPGGIRLDENVVLGNSNLYFIDRNLL